GYGHVYAQHVLARGKLDPAWPPRGRALFTELKRQGTPAIVTDGAGGLVAVWEELPTPYRFEGMRRSLVAQHVGKDGGLDPAWPATGLPLGTTSDPIGPAVLSDGAGGAVVAFTKRVPGDGICVIHVPANGRAGSAAPAPR